MKIAHRSRTRLKSRYSELDFIFNRRLKLTDPKSGLTRMSRGKRVLTDKGERYLVHRFIKKYAEPARRYKPLHYVLTSLFGSLKGKHILEVGPGAPLPIFLLKKRGAIAKGLSSGSVRGKGLVMGSVEDLPKLFKSEKFDGIISRDVFERGAFYKKGERHPSEPTKGQLSQIIQGMKKNLIKEDI